MKYIGAVSDTDILINLAKVNRLDILEHLFEQIVIPQFVFDKEIKRKAGRNYSPIVKAIEKEDSIFVIKDRKKDKALDRLSKEIIEEKKRLIGPGESECAGYAQALRIPIIVSDNYTEFRWLEEFITLTHKDLLTLCVFFDKITEEAGKEIYDSINEKLTKPSKNTFEDTYKRSMNTFLQRSWHEYLKVPY